jgi:hypothetical protein
MLHSRRRRRQVKSNPTNLRRLLCALIEAAARVRGTFTVNYLACVRVPTTITVSR